MPGNRASLGRWMKPHPPLARRWGSEPFIFLTNVPYRQRWFALAFAECKLNGARCLKLVMAWWSMVLMNAAASRSYCMYSMACTLRSHSRFQTIWFAAVLSRVFCATFVESEQSDQYKNPRRYEYVARHPASNAQKTRRSRKSKKLKHKKLKIIRISETHFIV